MYRIEGMDGEVRGIFSSISSRAARASCSPRCDSGSGCAFPGVEQLVARQVHNLEITGSSPVSGTRVCDGGLLRE